MSPVNPSVHAVNSLHSAGEGINMPARLRSLVQPQKPEIKVNFTTKKRTYTTLDRIEGTVTVTAPIDTPFDTLDVEFVGTSRTYVERLTTAAAATGRSEAFHQFLKLSQPGLQEYFPEDLVLKAGVSYEFPFVFAVPQQLLPRVCQHGVHSDAVRDCHLRLPPTFGDKDLAARSKGEDDMAPEMASVRYGIFVKITELKYKGEDVWRSIVASKARRLRVIPAVEEQPPLDIQKEDSEYTMRREKNVRKGVLKGKLGTLVMEAAQPSALQLKSYDNPEARSTTMATVMLRFDPLDDNMAPPKLGNLSSKLKVVTFFASTARHNFPTKAGSLLDLSQGLHSEQLNLSSRCMANVEWQKHERGENLLRRDSAMSGSLELGSTPAPSESYKGGAYYTARILVPVHLPANRAFVPTFHTCLISRNYQLKLDLSISSGLSSSMELKVPVQVSSEDLQTDELERRGSATSVDDVEVDVEDVSNFFTNFFEPRTIRVPSENFVGRSRIGSQAPVGDATPWGALERTRTGSEPSQTTQTQDDAPPGYTPIVPATTARMTHHRAMSVPVY